MTRARAAPALLVAIACGGAPIAPPKSAAVAAPKSMRVVREDGRAAIAIVPREGDPSPAIAAFVSTRGIGGARDTIAAVALAGLVESRAHVRATPQADGFRVSIETRDASEAIARVAAALAEHVTDATDVTNVRRKVLALAALPRAMGDEAMIASCEGAVKPPADAQAITMPTNAELESWRAVSDVRERVAFAVVGAEGPREAPALPSNAIAPTQNEVAQLAVYDASNAGASIVWIVWRGDLRVMNAARSLGEDSPLAAMIAATDASAHLRSATSSLSARGACLSVRIDLAQDAPDRIAAIAAVASREARAAIESAREGDVAWSTDATRAAEQAAIVALATDHATKIDDAPNIVIGTSATRDAIASALKDAERAWSTRVVESRARVERGQPSAWLLVASPCGTAGESENDAGASAAFATAAAAQARARGIDADAWISGDGVGIVARGDDAIALADSVARTFAIDSIDGAHAAQGRLLASSRAGLSALAEAIAPGRPASIAPSGTASALLRLSDASIAARADALRRGPVRAVAILRDDVTHADSIASHVDRFLARGRARACPVQTTPQPPKPGTYAIVTEDGTSEVYVAAMIPAELEREAFAIASMLDGGFLDAALGDKARERSARVLGPPGSRAIVVHISAPASALDASVAQLRALLDRLRQGAIRDEDLALAKKRDDESRAIAMRDPRARLIALFREEKENGSPSLENVRAAAQTILHDDALVIVAARPRASQKKP